MQLFVDMDGVLVDFDAHHHAVFGIRSSTLTDDVDWTAIAKIPGYYAAMPPMSDAMVLWRRIEHLKPVLLTGVPDLVPEASADKRAWAAQHLGSHVPVITCLSKDKCLHGKPGDLIIDDWEKHSGKWRAMGGIWVTHRDAMSTISELQRLGVL